MRFSLLFCVLRHQTFVCGSLHKITKAATELQPFAFIEVPDILISNELLEDMRKLADLYDYFKLTGAD